MTHGERGKAVVAAAPTGMGGCLTAPARPSSAVSPVGPVAAGREEVTVAPVVRRLPVLSVASVMSTPAAPSGAPLDQVLVDHCRRLRRLGDAIRTAVRFSMNDQMGHPSSIDHIDAVMVVLAQEADHDDAQQLLHVPRRDLADLVSATVAILEDPLIRQTLNQIRAERGSLDIVRALGWQAGRRKNAGSSGKDGVGGGDSGAAAHPHGAGGAAASAAAGAASGVGSDPADAQSVDSSDLAANSAVASFLLSTFLRPEGSSRCAKTSILNQQSLFTLGVVVAQSLLRQVWVRSRSSKT